MSGSSSKSEGYSSFIHDAAVPSTPVCCFIISIILYSYSNITGIYGYIFTLTFFILFIISLILTASRYKKNFLNKQSLFISALTVIIFCCSISFFLNNKIINLTNDTQLPEYLENISVIIDDVNFKRYSSEIFFHTTGNKQVEIKGIFYYQGENLFNSGDSFFLHKKIYKISADNKSQFNNYLISRGIHFTGGISDSDITILKKNDISARTNFQNRLLQIIDKIFQPAAKGLIKALLTGNQNYIEKRIIILFRNSGVLHCLSASGLHVAIFASIPAFLLIPFFRKNRAMLVSLAAVLLYLFITDMPVSLLRAVIMFGLFYLQLILFRQRNVFNCLMLTCSMILLVSPWELFSPGFQLSFAATAGILIFYKQYRQSLKALPGIIADTSAVTLSAQIITLPIILFHMKQLNTAGIPANIIIIPLITLIMGIAMFAILISFLSIPTAIFFGKVTEFLVNLSIVITNFISELKLNFYVYEITVLLFVIIMISLIPLIRCKLSGKLKYYPVLISTLLCTFYLKQNYQQNEKSYIITNGNSKAELGIDGNKQILKLNLEEETDTEKFISGIKMKNPDIKIIELENCSNSSLLASKQIMNDYIIDEYRFIGIPDLNNSFKKILFQLEKDNIIVKFN